MNNVSETWVYCTKHADGQVAAAGGPQAPVYEIEDHLACVPPTMANELVDIPLFTSRFSGKYVLPENLWRLATADEVQALLKKRAAAARIAVPIEGEVAASEVVPDEASETDDSQLSEGERETLALARAEKPARRRGATVTSADVATP